MISSSLLSISQSYNYKIKLDGVADPASAKYATDPIRELFKVYPTFNDSTDFFEFNSNVQVGLFEFGDYISAYGYSMIFFYREELLAKEEEK